MDILVGKDGTSFTIVVYHTVSVFSHSPFIVGILCSYFGIQVSNDQEHVMTGDFRYYLAKLFIPFVFNLVLGFIRWCIILNDCKLTML